MAATRPTSTLGYRPHLDGVRAIAVVLVIAFHAGYGWATGGFVGVDVFFVLSGYLITLLLVGELFETEHVRMSRFYARRARRLLPASVATLAVVAALSRWLLDAVGRAQTATDVRAAAAYAANWHLAFSGRDYFAPGDIPSPLVHYWSLAVEEQFYLVWPALLLGLWWLARRTGGGPARTLRVVLAATVAIAAASVALSLVLTPSPGAYYGTHTRAYQLLAGAIVALAVKIQSSRTKSPGAHVRSTTRVAGAVLVGGGIAGIVWAAHAIPDATGYPGAQALAVTAATVAVLVGLELASVSPFHRALGARPLAATGRLSYSLYLWHWPVLVFAPLLATRMGWGVLENRPLELAIVAAIALASYRLLEQPVRFRLRPAAPSPAVVAAGLALSAFVAFTAVPAITPAGATARTALAAVTDLARPIAGCPYFPEDWPSPAASRPCVVRTGGRFTVALVGDSHAQMWAPTLDALAAKLGFTFVTVTRGGCPANDILVYHIDDDGQKTPDENCSAWRDAVYPRLVAQYHPDVVIMSTRSYVDGIVAGDHTVLPGQPEHIRLWTSGFEHEARLFATGGAQVLVSEILPTLPQRVPACLAAHDAGTRACDFPATDDIKRAPYNAAIAALPSLVPGVHAFDPQAIVCPAGLCPARIGDVIVHRDDNHVTATFAGRVPDQFLALVRGAGVALAP
jgi:peptidoglycan/LPS O-acetylase OafA/YrhL